MPRIASTVINTAKTPKTPQTYCSPKSSANMFTCFNFEMLVVIARLYNENHDSRDAISIPTSRKHKHALWKALHSKFYDTCGNNETCWIEQDFVVKHGTQKQKLEQVFRPIKPSGWTNSPREWLNTNDILKVMSQYEDADSSFKFVGVFPVDFAAKPYDDKVCVVQEMCKLSLKDEWKNEKDKIGVIFNLDRHDEPGSHWTSLFIGLNPKKRNYGVFYYDSVATKPPLEIRRFMKEMEMQLKSLHPSSADKIRCSINTKRRQFKGTECGMFSMLFQILMLRFSFDNVCANMGYDDDVVKFRDVLYRPRTPSK